MLVSVVGAALLLLSWSSVHCQTFPADTAALTNLSRALFPTSSTTAQAANWRSNLDPCGQPFCGTSACNADVFSPAKTTYPPCTWEGICCVRGRVTSVSLLSIASASSVVLLPDGLQNLQALKTLSLPQRSLSGTLPAQLGSLPALTSLNLAANNFTGFLPSSWSHLRDQLQLQLLDLSHNNLTGQVPSTWYNQQSNGLAFISGLNLAGNTGLCNPPDGMQLSSSLPVCSPQVLSAQQQADPAAVTMTASPPATPSLAAAALAPPTADNGDNNVTGGTLKLLWPFLAIAVFGVLAVILILLKSRRQQAQLSQGGIRRSHSRHRRRAGPEDLQPKGPAPCLVIDPDGSHMTLAVQELLADTPAADPEPKAVAAIAKRDAEQGANHVQVLVHSGEHMDLQPTVNQHQLPSGPEQEVRDRNEAR